MATAIYPDGKKIIIYPKDKLFSIYEISHFLNGIVEMAFISNNWIFWNKLGSKMGLTFNELSSNSFGVKIYGVCLIIDHNELSSQFFVPNEPPPYLNKLISMFSEMMNVYLNNINEFNDIKELHEDNDVVNDDLTIKNNELDENLLLEEYNTIYKIFFMENKSYDELLKFLSIPPINDLKFDAKKYITVYLPKYLKNMIKFYTDMEEYEKCSQLQKFYDYILNSQKLSNIKEI